MANLRRTTLMDVARSAGVHVTTVSMALREHPRIPEATRKRLQQIAKELGYAPDPLLSALATYRARSRAPRYQSTIAYLTNWDSEWGWKRATAHLDFFKGAEQMAIELGFKLEHFWLRAPNLTEARLGRILRARGINGLILASHGREMGDAVELDWSQFSSVKVDYFPHQPRVHNVTNHQSEIVRLAVRKAREAGYRRIGLVMHRGWDHAVDHNWTAGYLCEQQEIAQADRVPTFIYPHAHPVERWLKEDSATLVPDAGDFAEWLRCHRPEVILSNAAFVQPVLARMKLKVPRDVAFIDLFLSDFSGAIAGVRQNHAVVGALAVELVSSQVMHSKRGIPEFPTTTFVEGKWFDGKTCPAHPRKPERPGRSRRVRV